MDLTIVAIIVLAVVTVSIITWLLSRYKRCPSDKILVIYGRTGRSATTGQLSSAKCIHGGGAFVWPVIQDYAFLDLKPISIEANLTNALSRQNIRVDVPCRFTIAISTEPQNMNSAAERLLGLSQDQIKELALDILFGQLRLVVATMTIEEINSDRDKFLANISTNVEQELSKVGLRLINVNVTDIRDESGYIAALGKEAAAKAINEAKVSVAEQEKMGEIGRAKANRDRDTNIAEAERDRDTQIAVTKKDKEVSIAAAMRDESIGKAEAESSTRIKTAEANAQAVKGENEAKITIADSEAIRREREAEANKRAITAEKIAQARALEESYAAEQKAEAARAERERSSQQANIIVPAEIARQKAVIEAKAEAERLREQAKGEADAIFAKMEAEAKGFKEILEKQAEGYERIVRAAGGDPKQAFQLLLVEKLPELVRIQVEAVKAIKIDKVTVWDNGVGQGNGASSTANFISSMMKSVPPLGDLLGMAGMDLPDTLKGVSADSKPALAPKKEEPNGEEK